MSYRFIGYFDESEDEHIFCLGGVAAATHHWSLFEDAWSALMDDYPGLPEFHAEHCVNRRGYWESWDDPEQRDAALLRFVDLIAASQLPFPMGFVVAIDLDAYRQSKRVSDDNPWVFAFRHTLDRVVEMQGFFNKATGSTERVSLFFDKKDRVAGRVNRLVSDIRDELPIGAVAFDDSQNQPGLQAADLIVYEARKALTEVIIGEKPMRESWRRLMNSSTFSGTRRVWAERWDAEALEFAELPRA